MTRSPEIASGATRPRNDEEKMMRKSVISVVIILFSIILLQGSASAAAVDLITNGNFSSGMASWTDWSWMVNATGNTLNWDTRPGGTNTVGNAIGATQTLNTDVSGYTSLIFKADVMPVYQSKASPGTWLGGLEYPVHIKIDYTDTGGTARDFQYGFYYSGNGSGTVPGTFVAQNTWYSYTSPDLLGLTYTPKTIDEVHIYGNDLNYAGSADNVQLLGTPVPEPASMILVGMGLFGFAGRVVKKRFKT